MSKESLGAIRPLDDHWSTRGDASGRRAPWRQAHPPPFALGITVGTTRSPSAFVAQEGSTCERSPHLISASAHTGDRSSSRVSSSWSSISRLRRRLVSRSLRRSAAGGPGDRVARARRTRPASKSCSRLRRAPHAVLRPRPSHAPHLARLLVWHRTSRCRYGAPGLRPPAHSLRREGLAGHLLHTTGMEHSPTSATGSAWERTPWQATQRAAWEALRHAEGNTTDPS